MVSWLTLPLLFSHSQFLFDLWAYLPSEQELLRPTKSPLTGRGILVLPTCSLCDHDLLLHNFELLCNPLLIETQVLM